VFPACDYHGGIIDVPQGNTLPFTGIFVVIFCCDFKG